MILSDCLRQVAETVEPLTGLGRVSAELMERANRLDQKQFTVALFGAFSAGKSSFANALLGDLVLPVSPNPTTAAINRILPPTNEFQHGSVRVQYKSAEALENDVMYSAGQIGLIEQGAGLTIPALVEKSLTITPDRVPPSAKVHLSFLKAVAKGYQNHETLLGTESLVDLDTFKKIVAKEEQACFVEWIELYYDCPLTANRIVLVDTPGADSINARHTGVAFDYIKNADAILFITYYNHAFSKADQQFLAQLGRVKGTFELDKLFFIINAADLAASPDEMDSVIAHLEQQLTKASISSSRIYPVSSQTAVMARLQEKMKLTTAMEKVYRTRLKTAENDPLPSLDAGLDKSGITKFETDFFYFLQNDLTQLAEAAAKGELQAIYTRLEHMTQLANSDQQQKAELAQQIGVKDQQVRNVIQQYSAESDLTALRAEVSTLLFYVRQRLFFNFADYVNEAFHPGLFREGQDSKTGLQLASREFTSLVRSTLNDEYRATALRLEKHAQGSFSRARQSLQSAIHEIDQDVSLGDFEPPAIEVPKTFIEDSPLQELEWKGVLGYYKSARDFFEGGGKEKLRDALEKLVSQAVEKELESVTGLLSSYYEEYLKTGMTHLQDMMVSASEDYFQTVKSALEDNQSAALFEDALSKIKNYIDLVRPA